jgi:hypothetical protein
MKDEIKEDMNANRKDDQEKAHADQEHVQKMIRTNQQRMEAKMREIIEPQFGSLAVKLDAWRKEMQADREARKTTDLKANPEETESKEENREVPKQRAMATPFRGPEQETQGPESCCRAKWRAKGTDPEEVSCCLQEGVPSCSSGTEQGKCLQENLDRTRNCLQSAGR